MKPRGILFLAVLATFGVFAAAFMFLTARRDSRGDTGKGNQETRKAASVSGYTDEAPGPMALEAGAVNDANNKLAGERPRGAVSKISGNAVGESEKKTNSADPLHAFSPPPIPKVAPLIGKKYPNDTNGDRIEDSLLEKVENAIALNPVRSETQYSYAPLDRVVQIELIFSEQISQKQIDAFLAIGGRISYIYRAVSYGWDGALPLAKIAELPGLMGKTLVLVQEPKPIKLHMATATKTGRVRPVWASNFSGNANGFRGNSNITIAILDTGVDESHSDLTGRNVYWRDFTASGYDSTPHIDNSGHGSHVAGIATGTGAASGIFTGALPITIHDSYEKGYWWSSPLSQNQYRAFPMDLPIAPIAVTMKAIWSGGGTSRLWIGDRFNSDSGVSGSYEQIDTTATGSSPRLFSSSSPFTPTSNASMSPILVANGAMTDVVVTAQIEGYPEIGDGFNKMSGVAPECSWASAKVLDDSGSSTSIFNTPAKNAIDDLVDKRESLNIKVINISFGSGAEGSIASFIDSAERQKVNTAVSNGIVVTASAGNDGEESAGNDVIGDPGRAAMALTVVASNAHNRLTEYSSVGLTSVGGSSGQEEDYKPDIMAPGGSERYSYILSVDSNSADGGFPDQQLNDYTPEHGTSMAAPFVAGCAALVIDALQQSGVTWWDAVNPSLHARFVKMVLCATASESNSPREGTGNKNPTLQRAEAGPDGYPAGKDRYEGYGMINPDAAVEAVSLNYTVGSTATDTLGSQPTERRAWARKVSLTAGQAFSPNLAVPAAGDFDLYLYSGTPSAYGTPIILASSTSVGCGVPESFTYTPASSGDAILVVKRVEGDGAFTLGAFAPTISNNPRDATVAPNGSATFSVAASGPGQLNYRWLVSFFGSTDWNEITESGEYSGSDSPTLTISPVDLGMNGNRFRCLVSNGFLPNALSDVVVLTVGTQASDSIVAHYGFENSASDSSGNGLNGSVVGGVTYSTGKTGLAARFDGSTGYINIGTRALDGYESGNFTLAIWVKGGPFSGESVILQKQLPTPDGNNPGWFLETYGNFVRYARYTSETGGLTWGTPLVSTTQIGDNQWHHVAVVRQGAQTSLYIDGRLEASAATGPGKATNDADLGIGRRNAYSDMYFSGALDDFRYYSTALSTQQVEELATSITYTVSTQAGTAGSSGSADGAGGAARFNQPGLVAVDNTGYAYLADSSNHTIRKISPAGVVTTFAGLANSPGSADGTGSAARFNDPIGVAVDRVGNVFVSEYNNHTIRKISASGEVTTLAGTALNSGSADGTGSAARFNHPEGLAVDSSGNVFVVDTGNCTIRKITPGGVVSTFAGSVGGQASLDGTGGAARFNLPGGIAIDASGNLFVADQAGHTIRKVTPVGVVTTIAGLAGAAGYLDGTGTAARFNQPDGMAVDSMGNLFVTDVQNHVIRRVSPFGVVTTVAGLAGNAGTADGIGSAAQFNQALGIAIDNSGSFIVSDFNNDTVRKVTVAGTTPLIGWWKFDGDVNDSGPNGLNGVNNGGTFIADHNGVVNSALRLRAHSVSSLAGVPLFATGDYVVVPTQNGQPALGRTFSIAFWMRPLTSIAPLAPVSPTTGIAGMWMMSQHSAALGGNSDGSWALSLVWDGPGALFQGSPTFDAAVSGALPVPTGAWSHIAFTYAAGQWTMYTNGRKTAEGTRTFDELRPVYDLLFGAARHPEGVHGLHYFYDGDLDDVRFYSAVLSAADAAGLVGLSSIPTAPVILAQPQAATVTAGASVTLAVTATSSQGLTYQWRMNGTNISGGTNSTLTLSSAQMSDAGSYDVVVSAGGTSVTSSSVSLTVQAAPAQLIGWWRFDGNVNDSGPNGLNGVYHGATQTSPAVFVPDHNGNPRAAIRLTARNSVTGFGAGTNFADGDFVQVTRSDQLALGNEFSVACWTRTLTEPTAGIANSQVVLGQFTAGATVGWALGPQNFLSIGQPGRFVFQANQYFDPVVNTGRAVQVGVWEHNAFVYSSGHWKMYVNGAMTAEGDRDYGLIPSSDDLLFGAVFHTGMTNGKFFFWNGELDDVRIYRGALSSGEVASLLNTASTTTITGQTATRQVLTQGQTVNLSVTATGTGTLSYQWSHNGRSIPGATLSTLSLSNVASAENGYYVAQISDTNGTLLSKAIFVRVVPELRQIRAWGANDQGQSSVPVGLSGVIAVAAQNNYSLALKADGTVVAWGDNSLGQTTVPDGLSNVVAVSAGERHVLALKSDGTVVAWGNDALGSLQVPAGLSSVVAVSACGAHSLALKVDGTVVAWGYNAFGQTDVPAGLNGVVALGGGGHQSVVLRADGSVVAWGNNVYGQGVVPSELNGVSVASVSARGNHNLALRADGTVFGWAENTFAQTSVPAGLANVTAIEAGLYNSLALKSDGSVVMWGRNDSGQGAVPPGVGTIVAASLGAGHTLALIDASTASAFNEPSYVFTTLAGLAGTTGTADGTGPAARFNNPARLVVDSGGNIYVADSGNHAIRKITPAGVVSVFAGLPGEMGSADGTRTAARFKYPSGVALDSVGNLYVTDTQNFTVRKITPAGVVTTVAGSAGTRGYVDGTGASAQFDYPSGIGLDSSNNLYVSDLFQRKIRKITPAGVVTTFAGNADWGYTYDLAVDGADNIYVADTSNHVIRTVTQAASTSILAGAMGSVGSSDGTGASAQFNAPNALTMDLAGNVYVADSNNFLLRRITPSGAVTTIGGAAGSQGTANGAGSVARFIYPLGVAVDSSGNIYVSDGTAGNPVANTIRKGTRASIFTEAPLITTQPANRAVNAGQPSSFTVVATGTPTPNYQWRKDGVNISGATTATLTIANTQTGDAGSYTVVASNTAGSVTSNVATLTVYVLPSVVGMSASRTAVQGTNVTLSVSASGTPAPTYQWNFNGSAINGATSSTYSIVNLQSGTAGSYTVTLSNAAGTVESAAAVISMVDAFADFVSGFGLNPASSGLHIANPSGDGLANLLKYAMGGDPTHAEVNLLPTSTLTTVNNVPVLVYQYNYKPSADYSVTAEYSADLSTWTTAVQGQNGVTITTTAVNGTTSQVTVSIPTNGGPIFARVRVNR